MNVHLLPGDSLKTTLSTPWVKKESTLTSKVGGSLHSVPMRPKNGQKLVNSTSTTSSNALPPNTFQFRKLEMQALQPIFPFDSVKLSLSTVEPMPGLGLPQRKLTQTKSDWVVAILLVILALFASVRLFFGKYLLQIFHAAVNYATASRLFRERSVSVTHAALRLDIIFFLTASLFLYQVAGRELNALVSQNFLKYVLILLGTFLFVIGKQFLYTVQGSLSETKSETSEFLYNMNLYNRVIGLGLLPVTLIIAFSRLRNQEIMIGIGALMFLFGFILLVFRGLKILVRKDFPLFYLILYLCTLEILPLLFIYKLVLD